MGMKKQEYTDLPSASSHDEPVLLYWAHGKHEDDHLEREEETSLTPIAAECDETHSYWPALWGDSKTALMLCNS